MDEKQDLYVRVSDGTPKGNLNAVRKKVRVRDNCVMLVEVSTFTGVLSFIFALGVFAFDSNVFALLFLMYTVLSFLPMLYVKGNDRLTGKVTVDGRYCHVVKESQEAAQTIIQESRRNNNHSYDYLVSSVAHTYAQVIDTVCLAQKQSKIVKLNRQFISGFPSDTNEGREEKLEFAKQAGIADLLYDQITRDVKELKATAAELLALRLKQETQNMAI